MYAENESYSAIQERGQELLQRRRREEEFYQDRRELAKENEKIQLREASKIRVAEGRMLIRQEMEEKKRAYFESVGFNQDGEIIVEIKNSQIRCEPRRVTNMRFAKIFIVARATCLEEQIFILEAVIAEKKVQVFLNPKRVGNGAYLIGKLAASGIEIFAPSARAKEYARKIVALLVGHGIQCCIPDEPGWIEAEEGKFKFIGQEGLTWEKALNAL